jgi:superfamily II RNA helicase
LAATALTEGEQADIQHVVMDEFHYYGDRDRGMAWQLPLLLLPHTAFLLMSATLGDTQKIADQLRARSGRDVALVASNERPVPLEFEYSTTPLMERIEELVKSALAPIYVVSFTQRDCAELAQSLTSINVSSKEDKERLKDELATAKFDTPYGKTVRKFLAHGIALHHGGLLPKYRLLVERLAQMGLLKVVCGTDTLGVGINLPLRTVLFTQLCKYDGVKVRLLKVRDFKQIAGRAGRKGYDDQGLVVAQAPPHVIENLRIGRKADSDTKKGKKVQRKKPPEKGYVHWSRETFTTLTTSESEELKSRFSVNHGMLLNLLQREGDAGSQGYTTLIDVIALSHESDRTKSRLRRKARMLFQSLRDAEIVVIEPRTSGRRGSTVRLADDLQRDFSIHHALSLFLVHAATVLNPDHESFHVTLLTFVEAIVENPLAVLYQQRQKERTRAYAAMKAEGIEYDQRQEKLEKITWPMPDSELVTATFSQFAADHPWVSTFEIAPKSVVRDMYEQYATFNEYVGEYELERSEGVLLRHISQVYKTLRQNVPEQLKTEPVHDLIAYVREVVLRADSSLVQEWERLRRGDGDEVVIEVRPEALDADRGAFVARVRAELREVVRALSNEDLEEAAGLLRQVPDDIWSPARLHKALDPFKDDYERILFDHAARSKDLFTVKREGPGMWTVTQVLCDPLGDNMWFLQGRVDLALIEDPGGRLFALEQLGT